MKGDSSALMLLAAGMFWNGSANFFSHPGGSHIIGIVGLCLTGLLILIAPFKWGHDV